MKRIVAALALLGALAWSGVAMAETKVGVGVGLGDLSLGFVGGPVTELRAPIHLGSFRIEPSIGLLYATTTSEEEGEGKFESTDTRLALGAGIHYVHSAHDKVELYGGPSLGIVHRGQETDVSNGGRSMTIEDTRNDVTFAAVLGVEYFAARSISLGVEVRGYGILLREGETTVDGEKQDNSGSSDASIFGTSGALTFRVYFL